MQTKTYPTDAEALTETNAMLTEGSLPSFAERLALRLTILSQLVVPAAAQPVLCQQDLDNMRRARLEEPGEGLAAHSSIADATVTFRDPLMDCMAGTVISLEKAADNHLSLTPLYALAERPEKRSLGEKWPSWVLRCARIDSLYLLVGLAVETDHSLLEEWGKRTAAKEISKTLDWEKQPVFVEYPTTLLVNMINRITGDSIAIGKTEGQLNGRVGAIPVRFYLNPVAEELLQFAIDNDSVGFEPFTDRMVVAWTEASDERKLSQEIEHHIDTEIKQGRLSYETPLTQEQYDALESIWRLEGKREVVIKDKGGGDGLVLVDLTSDLVVQSFLREENITGEEMRKILARPGYEEALMTRIQGIVGRDFIIKRAFGQNVAEAPVFLDSSKPMDDAEAQQKINEVAATTGWHFVEGKENGRWDLTQISLRFIADAGDKRIIDLTSIVRREGRARPIPEILPVIPTTHTLSNAEAQLIALLEPLRAEQDNVEIVPALTYEFDPKKVELSFQLNRLWVENGPANEISVSLVYERNVKGSPSREQLQLKGGSFSYWFCNPNAVLFSRNKNEITPNPHDNRRISEIDSRNLIPISVADFEASGVSYTPHVIVYKHLPTGREQLKVNGDKPFSVDLGNSRMITWLTENYGIVPGEATTKAPNYGNIYSLGKVSIPYSADGEPWKLYAEFGIYGNAEPALSSTKTNIKVPKKGK